MKFCTHCGNQLLDEAVICPKCGCAVDSDSRDTFNSTPRSGGASEGMVKATKALLIVACIFSIFSYFIPLIWCIPMTVSYYRKKENGEPISPTFKICTLLFVSTLAGILMLFDNEQGNNSNNY